VTLDGRVALVTGGGTGIGAAVARRFAAAGARVAVAGRRAEPLRALAAEVDGLALAGDCGLDADARRIVGEILERHGHLDVVVANAGGHGYGAVLETDDREWAASLHSNLTTAFVTIRAALPSLIAARGSIVVVASEAGLFAGPRVVGYTTAKHALLGLTRSLARDYGRDGVRVNAICPGWVRTPMADEEMAELGRRDGISVEEAYAAVTADVPLGRAGTPDEIAAISLFLASEEASFMSGAVLVADGGAHVVDLATLPFDERRPASGPLR
jgi:meso-butanediol dehydrogenase / (S,S)-butanediol dehydrogenase / diacetyl reductase